MQLREKLKELGACKDVIDWLGERDLASAWRECDRGDWMIWLAARIGADRKLVVIAACRCARLVLRYVPAGETRPLVAIETAEKWARGEASLEQVKAVTYRAYAATGSAYCAYAAANATYSAYACGTASAAIAAAKAAAYVVSAASEAVSAPAAAAARDCFVPFSGSVDSAAISAKRAVVSAIVSGKCADICREVFSLSSIVELAKLDVAHKGDQ